MIVVEVVLYVLIIVSLVWVLRFMMSGPVSPRDRRFLRDRQREIDRNLRAISRNELRRTRREETPETRPRGRENS